jgi:dienelactone hydrolase
MPQGHRAATSRTVGQQVILRHSKSAVARWFVAAPLAIALCVSSSGSVRANSLVRPPGRILLQTTSAMPAVPPTDATVFASPGPYSVGVITTTLAPKKEFLEVWYPATVRANAASSAGVEVDLRSLLSSKDQRAWKSTSFSWTLRSSRNVASLSGTATFPVVIMSHDNGSHRLASSFLAEHLASWGFVVAAPDHANAGVAKLVAGQIAKRFDFAQSSADFNSTIRTLTALSTKPGTLQSRLDLNKLTMIGHGTGADAAITWTASNDAVQGVVALSGGATRSGVVTVDPLRPILWLVADDDRTVATAVARAFQSWRSPRRLVRLSSGGAQTGTAWCEWFASRPLAKPDRRQVLKTRFGVGCNSERARATDSWPIVTSQTVAQLRSVLGAGSPGFGLDQGTLNLLTKSGATPSTFAIG